MSEKNIVRKSADELGEGQTDWDRVDSLTDEEIEQAAGEDPDQELLGDEWFRTAELVVPGEKKRITMHVDQDVIDYFKREGRGYQTRMNAVLKSYVLHQKRKTPKHKFFDQLSEALRGLSTEDKLEVLETLSDLKAAYESMDDAEKNGGTKDFREFLKELGNVPHE